MKPCILFTVHGRWKQLLINIKLLKRYAGIDLPIIIATNNTKFPFSEFKGYEVLKVPNVESVQRGELSLVRAGIKRSNELGFNWTLKMTADKFVIYPDWLKKTLKSFHPIDKIPIGRTIRQSDVDYANTISKKFFHFPEASCLNVWPTFILSQIYLGFTQAKRDRVDLFPQIRTDLFMVDNNFAIKHFPDDIPRIERHQMSCIESELYQKVSKFFPPIFSSWWLLDSIRCYVGGDYYKNTHVFHSHISEEVISFLKETKNEDLCDWDTI